MLEYFGEMELEKVTDSHSQLS
ncbi:hypothetical protein MH147_06260 [Bacillus pumilus]|nr:hypothetical protein [Bacillus pumilus]MEC3592634.1 hypothetical protein [Bacillus pumilus]